MSKTTNKDPRFNLRIPVEIKKWLAVNAIEEGRSMTSEIIVRLERCMREEQAQAAKEGQ